MAKKTLGPKVSIRVSFVTALGLVSAISLLTLQNALDCPRRETERRQRNVRYTGGLVGESSQSNRNDSSGAYAAADFGEHEDAEFRGLLAAADALIEHSKLGGYGAFVAPFTAQFKQSLRETFPGDKQTFDESDRNENKAIYDALRMRLFTFGLFALWSLFTVGLFQKWFSLGNADASGWQLLGLYVVVSAVVWMLRFSVRYVFLSAIGGDATRFANYFFKQLTNIHDRSINAVRASNDDMMLSSAWPDRSAGWIKIALWHGKRYENLDRYVTATAWRVESRYRIIEGTFRWLKTLIVIGVLLVTLLIDPTHGPMADMPPEAIIVYVVVTLMGWGLVARTSNAYWAEKFRPSITGFDEQKEHIHVQVAKVVAGDKKLIMSDKRNVGKERNG